MEKIYTIKSYIECPGVISKILYQGRKLDKKNETPIISMTALDKRIREIMEKQEEILKKNPKLNSIIETIEL
jgi:hypothetical protein